MFLNLERGSLSHCARLKLRKLWNYVKTRFSYCNEGLRLTVSAPNSLFILTTESKMNSCRKQLMKDWWNEKNGVRKFPFLDFERLCHRRLTHLEKYPVLSLRFSLFHFGILSYCSSPKILKNKISILGHGRKVGLIWNNFVTNHLLVQNLLIVPTGDWVVLIGAWPM